MWGTPLHGARCFRLPPIFSRTPLLNGNCRLPPRLLKERRELFHSKPGLSNQRSKSPLGKFSMVWNGEASMWRSGAPKNDVAPVLFIEFVPGLRNALTASLPETTGNFIRQQPQLPPR